MSPRKHSDIYITSDICQPNHTRHREVNTASTLQLRAPGLVFEDSSSRHTSSTRQRTSRPHVRFARDADVTNTYGTDENTFPPQRGRAYRMFAYGNVNSGWVRGVSRGDKVTLTEGEQIISTLAAALTCALSTCHLPAGLPALARKHFI